MKNTKSMSPLKKFTKKTSAFLPSLLVSYISIIVICTLIVGTLSCQIIRSAISKHTISSNNRLLSQFRTSIDLVLVQAAEDASLKIMQDLNNDYSLNRFYSESLEENLVYTSQVSTYLNEMSVLNPMIFSISLYYSNYNLLVSTDSIRHTLYKPMNDQKDLMYYYDMIQQTAEDSLIGSEQVSMIFDNAKNLEFKYSNVYAKKPPETIIHAVRIKYGYNKSIKGAVIVTFSGDIFKNSLSKYAPEELGSIFIFDNKGNIISHTNSAYIGHNISELELKSELINISDDQGYFMSNVGNTPVVVSYQSSTYDNWTYASIAPMDAVTSATNEIFYIILLITLSSILIGIVISVISAKKLAKPIKSIADYCVESPYSISSTMESNEYSLISNTINNMENIMDEKREDFKKVLPTLRINFLSALLSDNPPEPAEIKARMKMLDINFPYKYFCTAAVRLEKLEDSENVLEYEYEKINIGSQLKKTFITDSSLCQFYEEDGVIAVIFNFNFTDKILHENGRKFLEQNIPLVSCLSFGKIDASITCINLSYKFAKKGLKYHYVFPEKNLFTFKDIIGWENKHSPSIRLLLKNLDNSLQSLDCGRCVEDLGKITQTLRDGSYSYNQIYSSLLSCVSKVESFICTQVGKEIDLDHSFNGTDNILEFEQWITGTIKHTFENIDNKESSSDTLVNSAQEMIEQNIQNTQLSLGFIANELGISAKHLSKIFKDKTGVNFIDYVTNLKLNHSRNLLISTDLKVEEISDIIGYSTSHYFISRFKIMFGCTPNKYREEYRKKMMEDFSENQGKKIHS